MTGWRKFFIDGKSYWGADDDPNRSWRTSRSEGQIGTELYHGVVHLSLFGPPGSSAWWQSDDLVLRAGENSSCLVCRRIQKQLNKLDNFISITRDCSSIRVNLYTIPPSTFTGDCFRPVHPAEINKWITLEYNLVGQGLSLSFLDGRK
jgi:hypothetical protein